jgi:hypothetical protein
METLEISVLDLKPGAFFKETKKQKYFRCALKIIDWKPGDTEFLKGKRLVILSWPSCKQLLINIESKVIIPKPRNPTW